jgi:hypothetical protein
VEVQVFLLLDQWEDMEPSEMEGKGEKSEDRDREHMRRDE